MSNPSYPGHSKYLYRLFALLFVSGSILQADFISGRVVDANGIGVPGIDIDVDNLGSGGDPTILNDGTDANGFFLTTVPAGIYRVLFLPPAPPASTHLTAILDNVLVTGTTDMGVITLPAGIGLTGRVVDGAGFPLANVNLDVTDLATGTELILKNGKSDLFGLFGVAVPANSIHLDFDPLPVISQNLVPIRMTLSPTESHYMGDIVLESGFILAGTLQNSLGMPVSGVDLDVFDSATGEKFFTPHDNSNLLGVYSLVLPAGLFDIEFCPSPLLQLVAFDLEGFSLLADTNLGITTLMDGVSLFGIVRDTAGLPVPGMDVDVNVAVLGTSIVTCSDNTGAAGNYSVVVPTGTLDVGFAPPGRHGTSAEDLHEAVIISGDTLLDGTIPAPLALFSGTPRTGMAPLTVSFTDLSTGATSGWMWDFGDSTSSTQQHPVHTYTSPGAYTVSLTTPGIGGPSTLVEVGYVDVVPPPPSASFAANPTAGTAPLSVSFSDSSLGAISAWAWNFGDLGTSTLQDPVHTYALPGAYTVTLTVAGPGGFHALQKRDFVVVSRMLTPPQAPPASGGEEPAPPPS